MKIYYHFFFFYFCSIRKVLPSIIRTRFVDEWRSVEKRNGDEISSTLEFFSGCAPSGQIAVEDKAGGVIASFETVRRKFRLNRNERQSASNAVSIRIAVLYPWSYISRANGTKKRFVIGHRVPMLACCLGARKKGCIKTSPVFESLNCKIRSFSSLWKTRYWQFSIWTTLLVKIIHICVNFYKN